MIVLLNGRKHTEHAYTHEADFEQDIILHRRSLFGPAAVYIDAKKKIASQSLGAAVPDGFLFDLSDPRNREFYLIEVELAKHDFFKHIFPQITKFFAFFTNPARQKELVEGLFAAINTDTSLKRQFKKYLGEEEVFKFLNDIVDGSQNILLILDGEKPELPEIMDTYTDTWGKMVKVMTVRKFVDKSTELFVAHPEFETIEYGPPDAEEDSGVYPEQFHLDGVSPEVREIYGALRKCVQDAHGGYVLNSRKYYVAIKGAKNLAFISTRKKKVRLVVILSEEEVRSRVKKHAIKVPSQAVQRYWGGTATEIMIEEPRNLGEVTSLIRDLMKQYPPKASDEPD